MAAKFAEYLPMFAGATDVVDLGCGRGEFLAALQSAGVRARGVDSNDEMVAVARERGLDATHGDALAYLAALPDESIGGLIATQVVEHLEPSYLNASARHGVRGSFGRRADRARNDQPGVLVAFFSSYIRDLTHVRPVHPETLQYLLRASGFERVEIRYRSPLPDHVKMKTIDVDDITRWSGIRRPAPRHAGPGRQRERRHTQQAAVRLHGLRGDRIPQLIVRAAASRRADRRRRPR